MNIAFSQESLTEQAAKVPGQPGSGQVRDSTVPLTNFPRVDIFNWDLIGFYVAGYP